MRLSVVTPLWQDRHPDENLEIAVLAEELGYDELWVGEMATFDAFGFATSVGRSCPQLTLTLGPLPVGVRTPMTMAMGAATVANLTGNSTRLAIGTSSRVVVEQWHQRRRRATAEELGAAAASLRALVGGERDPVGGYRLRLDPPEDHLTVAAFGPRAVEVAAEHADRMVLNLVTPDVVERLHGQLRDAAAGDPPTLAVWLICALDPTAEVLDQIRHGLVGYLAAPGYDEMFRAVGLGAAVDQAHAGAHPRDLAAAIPEDVPEALGLVGSRAGIESAIDRYVSAGAQELCLVPATADGSAQRTLAALASS